jgi:CTP:molybdopterin cytidylyltransferase MocA
VSTTPALVLLAAGASARLGSCKALVDLGGRTPLARLLAAGACMSGAPLDPLSAHDGGGGRGVPALVVTGRHHAEIAAAAPAGCEPVRNPDWRLGRTGTVQLAHRLRPGLALCLAPVDVPLVPAEVFRLLRAAWERAGSPPAGWLAPRAGRHGHPVVVGPALLARGLLLAPDRPLRELRALAAPLLDVPVPGNEVLEDLDTVEDLARIRARLGPGAG